MTDISWEILNLPNIYHTLNNLSTTLPLKIKRWMCGFLRGRQTQVDFRNSTSKTRAIGQGVIQGRMMPPTLFKDGISLASCTDDFTILTTGHGLNDSEAQRLSCHALHLICEQKPKDIFGKIISQTSYYLEKSD